MSYNWQKIARLRFQGNTWAEVANVLGVNKHTLRSAWSRIGKHEVTAMPEGMQGQPRFDPDTGIATAQMSSLEDLIAYFDIDLTEWEVKKWLANQWAGFTQVKAWLDPRQDLIDAKAVIEDMLEDAKQSMPARKRKRYTQGAPTGNLLELAVFDHHFGMLAWGPEVAGPPWDTKVAYALYMQALERLSAVTQAFPVERILLPIGNDMLHVDGVLGASGAGGTTTSGTAQDVDTRWKKMFTTVRRAVIEGVDMLTDIAPVTIVVVPGNHDEHRMFYLGDSLECWYHNDPNVTVNNEPRLHKYFQWGDVMLGFTHGKFLNLKKRGDKDELPMVMANEEPQMWADTKFREWHIGHTHRKQEKIWVPVAEKSGVRARVIPSLVTRDAWHYQEGWIGGIRAAEAYLWNQNAGFTGMFSVNVLEGNDVAAEGRRA